MLEYQFESEFEVLKLLSTYQYKFKMLVYITRYLILDIKMLYYFILPHNYQQNKYY